MEAIAKKISRWNMGSGVQERGLEEKTYPVQLNGNPDVFMRGGTAM